MITHLDNKPLHDREVDWDLLRTRLRGSVVYSREPQCFICITFPLTSQSVNVFYKKHEITGIFNMGSCLSLKFSHPDSPTCTVSVLWMKWCERSQYRAPGVQHMGRLIVLVWLITRFLTTNKEDHSDLFLDLRYEQQVL